MKLRGTLGAMSLSLSLGACGSNAGHINLGSMPPGVTMDARVHYYDISAASLSELRRGMAASGPRAQGRTWSAVTQTNFRWTYQYQRTGVSCEVRRVRIQLRTTITFPRWNPTAEPDSSLLEWWHQLNAGLMEHERGHALISVDTANEIIRELEGMSGIGCESLGTRANTAGHRLMNISRQRQADYDRTTRHGRTQIEQAGRLRSP
jgi:predicted secreted Zn-dependent protease